MEDLHFVNSIECCKYNYIGSDFMKTVMIVCAGGATSGLLAAKVAKESEKIGLKTNLLWMHDVNVKDNADETMKGKRFTNNLWCCRKGIKRVTKIIRCRKTPY